MSYPLEDHNSLITDGNHIEIADQPESSEETSDADDVLYTFEKTAYLPGYSTIRRADLITRPDGMFVICLFGDLVDPKYFYNSRLLLFTHARGFRLAFRRYGLRDKLGRYMPTKDLIFAEIELVETQPVLVPVLKAHKWIDVFLFKKTESSEEMNENDVQNFLACISK